MATTARRAHTPAITPLPMSPWIARTATDHEGHTGAVRRVVAIDGVEVATLTGHRTDTSTTGPDIWDAPVDVLSASGIPARFPSYRALLDEEGALLVRVVKCQASDEDKARLRELHSCTRPYTDALTRLHLAQQAQITAGDRVALIPGGQLATVVDPDPEGFRADLPVSPTMLVRLDQGHLRENPHLRERHPHGLVMVPTPFVCPTLGLL